jgi:hypothetical protein
MAKEVLQNVITDMGNSIFPDGSPVDSTHNVQKGYFQSCGEVVAVSLAQGGPPRVSYMNVFTEQWWMLIQIS